MEILIGFLLLAVCGIIFVAFKFMSDDDKRSKTLEDAKGKRISDLEAEVGQKDSELKKALSEAQRLEEEFYKAKDEADIAKKDVSELQIKIKSFEKDKNDSGELKNEVKQKEQALQQETVARQKLQGEVSLKDLEIDKKSKEAEQLRKDVEKLTAELKDKAEMLDGLKGQYNEMEAELQKVRMAQALDPGKTNEPLESDPAPKLDPEPPKEQAGLKAGEPSESLKADEPSKPSESDRIEDAPKPPESLKTLKPLNSFEPVEPPRIQPPPLAEVKINQGFGFTKAELKQSVPSDTDFLKVQSPQIPKDTPVEIPDGAFKLTNVNRPQGTAPGNEKKSKSKDENPPELSV